MIQETQLKGLYGILFKRLIELKNSSKTEIIPFPSVFQKLCSSFSIPKQECWNLLFMLRDMNFIEIVPFHGIKIIQL